MASASVAVRLADELGITAERAQTALRGVDDDEALRLLSEARAGPRSTFGEALNIAVDQPSRIGGQALSASKKTLLGLGAIGGGTAVGFKGVEALGDREQRLTKQEQGEALQAILRDPHLSDTQRNRLIKELTSQGFFSGDGGDGDGGQSPLAGLFSGLGLGETALILIVVWFIGKALVEAAGSAGGS